MIWPFKRKVTERVSNPVARLALEVSDHSKWVYHKVCFNTYNIKHVDEKIQLCFMKMYRLGWVLIGESWLSEGERELINKQFAHSLLQKIAVSDTKCREDIARMFNELDDR